MNERGLVDLRELERVHPSSTFTRRDGKVKKRLKEEPDKQMFWLSSTGAIKLEDQMPPTIDDLPEIVEQFRREIGYTGELRIKGPHHRYKYVADPTMEVQFPHANEPGCYVFFSEKGRRVLYVGKGSRYMGGRIWAPFGRQKRDGEVEPFPNAKPWVKEHKPGVWAIAVPQDHWWLAMALEGFLIERFKPPENRRLR